MIGLFLAVALQLQIPAPTGYVNDFAGILDPASKQAMQGVIDEVREKSGGEIVVVTLPGIEGRASIDVARDIGREWKVGATGGPGDRARNAGVIVLLVPGERPGDGRAELAIATGTGAEGFVTDARAGRIRDAIGRASVENGSYAAGLVAGVWLLGEAYANEFEFELTGQPPVTIPQPTARAPSGGSGILAIILIIIIIAVLMGGGGGGGGRRYGRRRYRRSGLDWLVLATLLGGGPRGRSWGGGGRWGGGGFGGGGFGGFGGGGGFSGGGASGSF
jgi:uncharacterized protein